MTIKVIGDIHGRDIWKKIVSNDKADLIIFIGDYWDSKEGNEYYIPYNKQRDNFREIIKFKKANKEKVILLFGNHDYHYLSGVGAQYTGFQALYQIEIRQLLEQAINERLIQMCYIWGQYIFTHAGITNTWCRNNKVDLNNLQHSINELFYYRPLAFTFARGDNDSNYGDDITQSPIWVRPRSLYVDKVPNYIYVVGHTIMDVITGLNGSRKIYTNGRMVETSGVIFIDTLGTSKEYLRITNGTPEAIKII